jgi:DNA-binding transcriptional LysR family regulator
MGDFLGEKALADGRLIELFKDRHDADPKPISMLILPGRQNIPRIRAFVDFLKDNIS